MVKENLQGVSLIKSFSWRFFELIASQGVSFIVSILLARLLLPSEYGSIALVSVFISIMDVFVTRGFGTALIQKKNADNVDFSTVFFFNICFTGILYLVIFFLAPYVALFYKDNQLCILIRVLGIRTILSGVNSVQQAYVSKRMDFKKFFFATIGGTILSGVIGIVMAYFGCGVWALVVQYLLNAFVDTLILWLTVKWRPILAFSIKRLKGLFGYGWKILGSGLLGAIYGNLQTLIIGKMESSSELACYNKGKQFPQTIVSSIATAIEGVMFPAMANHQENVDQVKEITKRSIVVSSYVMFPLTLGLLAVARPLIILLLTKKWENCVLFLQIACIVYLFWPVQTVNLQAIKAMGRSDIFLTLEVIKKVIGILGILLGACFGVKGIIISEAVCSVITLFVDVFPNRKTISYGLLEQLRDFFPSLALSVIMCVCVIGIGKVIQQTAVVQITIQVLIGGVIYLIGSKICNIQGFCIICNIVNEAWRRKRRK